MVIKVTAYKTKDGSLFVYEYDAVRHEAPVELKFECPMCKGYGRINGNPVMKRVKDDVATGFSGSHTAIMKNVLDYYEQNPCKVCDAKGWTKDERKPIYSDKIIGYK